ncbi:MAG: hypothetical protein ABFR75_13670 [Acidobacteriota bacterium]
MGKGIEHHPDNRKLVDEYNELLEQFSGLISNRSDLLNNGKPNLEALYMAALGEKKYEKFELEIEVRRIKRKIDLIQQCINRSEPVEESKIEEQLDEELEQWTVELEELYEKVERSKQEVKLNIPVKNFEEIRKVYIKLVKLIHPDIDPSGELLQYWDMVQQAYERRDLEELKSILLVVEGKGGVVKVPPEENELKLKIKGLKERITVLVNSVKEIMSSFPFTIADKIKDKIWVEDKKKELGLEISRLKESRMELLKHLEFMLEPGKGDAH